MKRFIFAGFFVLLFGSLVSWAIAADVNPQLTIGTKRDSLTSVTTTYQKLDSITFGLDSALRGGIIYVSGELFLSHTAKAYVSLSNIAGGTAGDTMIILGNDTVFTNTQHIYQYNARIFDPELRVPFSFQVPIDHDTTGAVIYFLNVKKGGGGETVKLYNVRMDALINLYNDSI